VVGRRTELRYMKYRLKGLGRKMTGSLLETWMGGAKGKEGFLFETNQPAPLSFPPKTSPQNQNKRTVVVGRAE